MNETLKDLLFKKVIDLKKSKKAPLFKSQKALATEIIDNNNHYNNYISVVSLLSKAFRKKNPVPLPKKLEAEIRTLIYKKVEKNNPILDEIEKKFIEFTFEVAEQYNSPAISYNEYIKEGIQFEVFSNNPPPLLWCDNKEAEYFMDMMIKKTWDGLSINQIPKFRFYVSDSKIANEVWHKIENYCSHKKIFIWDGVHNALNKLNKLGIISIYLVNTKKLIYPVTYIQHNSNKLPKIAFITSYIGTESVSVSHLSLVDTESWFNGIKDLLGEEIVDNKRMKSEIIYNRESMTQLSQYYYKTLQQEFSNTRIIITESKETTGHLKDSRDVDFASQFEALAKLKPVKMISQNIDYNDLPVSKEEMKRRKQRSIEAKRNLNLSKIRAKNKLK